MFPTKCVQSACPNMCANARIHVIGDHIADLYVVNNNREVKLPVRYPSSVATKLIPTIPSTTGALNVILRFLIFINLIPFRIMLSSRMHPAYLPDEAQDQ